MNKDNRDLLVLFRNEFLTKRSMERQVTQLHKLLYSAESLDNFVKCHEIIDLNKYTVIRKHAVIRAFVRLPPTKAFVFLFNKN
ncbi:MAG: hypothetical protein IPG30_11440 [Chitinophagaceae bacterium]|nr:hypothetical protein [Chitinophagaceae bacterium]